jgi:hypothetical protein
MIESWQLIKGPFAILGSIHQVVCIEFADTDSVFVGKGLNKGAGVLSNLRRRLKNLTIREIQCDKVGVTI